MTGPAVGIVVAVLVDIVVPLALAGLLIRHNARHRRSRRSEATFWLIAGGLAIPLVLLIVGGVADVFDYRADRVIGVTLAALPGSLIPMLVHSNVMSRLFTDAQWETGYFSVLTIYVVGMAAWALVNATALRASASAIRRGFSADLPRIDERARQTPK
ncbi:MAG: hypothetical protein KF727_04315 [Microbacteriaceae bacterium]|nr:hypothetical protein [Microbacteriaceae bacterium]